MFEVYHLTIAPNTEHNAYAEKPFTNFFCCCWIDSLIFPFVWGDSTHLQMMDFFLKRRG